jgi:hypothetical protein
MASQCLVEGKKVGERVEEERDTAITREAGNRGINRHRIDTSQDTNNSDAERRRAG